MACLHGILYPLPVVRTAIALLCARTARYYCFDEAFSVIAQENLLAQTLTTIYLMHEYIDQISGLVML